MKKLIVCCLSVFAAAALFADNKGNRERPEPTYDELVAYLKLSDSQLACLKTNLQAFRDAVAPDQARLRDLQRQLRQATQSGADTTALRSQIEALQKAIQETRSRYVTSAQSCIGGPAALRELIAAETLRNEVREAISLLLIPPTESNGPGPGF